MRAPDERARTKEGAGAQGRIAVALFAAASLTLGGILYLDAVTREARAGTADRERVAALVSQIEALERRAAALALARELSAIAPDLRDGKVTSPAAGTTGAEALVVRIDERVSILESLVADLENADVAAWDFWFAGPQRDEVRAAIRELERGFDEFPHIDWLARSDQALTLEGIARLRELARDPTASALARAEAIAALRAVGRELGIGDALVDEPLCRTLIDAARGTTDDAARETLYGAIGGAAHRGLRAPLLEAARHDVSPKVRDQVVSNLRFYLPDDEVAQTLRDLRDHDPSPEVRDEADEALGGG